MSATPELDETSKQIIEILQQDGRRPYAAVAEEVGLSEAAVRQRVKRFTASGLLQIVAVTDPLQMGFQRQAMVGIRVRGSMESAAEMLGSFPEIHYLILAAGSFDILAEVVCEDDAHLLEILNKIRDMESVTTTETFIYLSHWKDQYTWGTR